MPDWVYTASSWKKILQLESSPSSGLITNLAEFALERFALLLKRDACNLQPIGIHTHRIGRAVAALSSMVAGRLFASSVQSHGCWLVLERNSRQRGLQRETTRAIPPGRMRSLGQQKGFRNLSADQMSTSPSGDAAAAACCWPTGWLRR